MNNYNPFFNTINMTRNASPFATAGSSAISGISQAARTGGLFSRIATSKMSLSEILNGAQKTIGTVNQIVPLYNQVKPMLQNSKILLNVAKGLKDGNSSSKSLFRHKRRNYNYQKTVDISKETVKEETKKEEKPNGNSPSKPYFA